MRLRIEKAIYGGAGLARQDGRAVFVPFTLPGEEVEAELRQDKGGYATAELQSVIEKSARRIQPPCPYFGACGGCHYQHADYAAQVEMKAAILRETLERARVGGIPEIEPVTGEPFGYRNRIRLHVSGNPFALCYKLRESRVNLPVTECPIAAPALAEAVAALSGARTNALGEAATEIEFVTNENATSLLVTMWMERDEKQAKRLLQESAPGLRELLPQLTGIGVFSVERGRRMSRLLARWGEESLTYTVRERRYRVSAGSFFQVNRFLLGPLVDLVTEAEHGAEAWDLYAGVGLFSLPLTERFGQVVAVESAGASARDLRENLRGTAHRIVAADTLSFLRQAAERRLAPPDLIVVDPPRAGLGREITELLGRIGPARITYVSCDPATLSRDLGPLLESGYRLDRMHLLDLFPQTLHLESVTHLSRT